MSEGRVLIVEDDPKMQRLLDTQLTMRGYRVHVVGDGAAALLAAAEVDPHVILLDIGLPGMDGLEVCRCLREWSSVPILVVTAADTPQLKIKALELGGDDYLVKPFHMGELIARIRAVLRRTTQGSLSNQAVIEADDLAIDLVRREVRRDGEPLHLTKIEFDLLRVLATQPNRVLCYDDLLSSIWGTEYHDIRLVHVHICNLRRKLEPLPSGVRHILAVPGVGYKFRLGE
jgi:two-component system KDP operon response regulator KdpE